MASSSSSSPEISAALPDPHVPHTYADYDDALDDVSSRFILNLPDEELDSLERICFQVEQAHWFYEDFIRESNPSFQSLTLKKFSEMLFNHCPLLERWADDHDAVFSEFMQYKTRVPVCGAIMLNDKWDKCVLVKGWKSSAGWGFPKGKINEEEESPACAVREVFEETGYNLAGQINPKHYIRVSIREQAVTLFIVPNVPESYHFETKTRKEISKIEWFRLADLPTWSRRRPAVGKFYLITPFISPLRHFVSTHKPRKNKAPDPDLSQFQELFVNEDNDHDPATEWNLIEDSNVQESGSQTSSADNGDPQTPSPLYSEPAVHPVQVSQTSISGLETEALDPHFARLLNNLSLSASSAPIAIEKSSLTPGPTSPRSIVHHAREGGQPLTSTAKQQAPTRPPSVPALQRTIPSSASPAPEVRLAGPGRTPTSPISSHIPSPPVSSLPTAISPRSTKMLHNGNTMSNRPPTTTADISPYLSKSDAVVNGKRLRQLALLESVVDEAARMTPVLNHRGSYMSPPSTAPTGSFPSFAPPPPPFQVPPTSTSVPPPNATPGNLSMSYRSQETAPPHTIYQTIPYNPVHPSMSVNQAGAFRPQTSQSFHPHPMHSPPRSGNMRGSSMSQAQLLGVLSGGPSPIGFLNATTPAPGHPSSYFPAFAPARGKLGGNASLLGILNNHGGAMPPTNPTYMGGPPY